MQLPPEPRANPDETSLGRARAAIDELPRRKDQLLPALLAVQGVLGWIPPSLFEHVHRHTRVPRAEAFATASAYSELHFEPEPLGWGVCTGPACRIAGADALRASPEGEVRDDVRTVDCQFMCAMAPAAIDFMGRLRGRLAPGDLVNSFHPGGLPLPPDWALGVTEEEEHTPPRSLQSRREAFERRTRRIIFHGGTCSSTVAAMAARSGLEAALHVGGHSLPVEEAGCDGACWAAPAATVIRDGHTHRHARVDLDPQALVACLDGECDAAGYAGTGARGLTARLGRVTRNLDDILDMGGYVALERALRLSPSAVIDAVERTELTGRGGAHFPVASKWRLAAAQPAPRYLLVNAEEGEPGVFKDRHLLEGDPHRLIEGALIACHATGAEHVIVYVNGQARGAHESLRRALRVANTAGIISGGALGTTLNVTFDLRSGAGGYVCGEESVIMNSVEGERPVPRYKPPFATDTGLFGRPTIINNVETLAAVTTIFDDPPPPTKLVSLSGSTPRPGLYEVPVDGSMHWAGVLASAGVNPDQIRALLVGGPSGQFVPREQFEQPLDMRTLGAGGVLAIGNDVDVAALTRDLAAYNMRESCGECTPCREGTRRLVELLDHAPLDRDKIHELVEVMTDASLCQLGGMAGRPVSSALAQFPEAFDR